MFVEVVLPLNLSQTYTYDVPVQMEDNINVGARVMVAFGSDKMYSGIIFEIHHRKPEFKKIKSVIEIIDPEPVVTANQLKLWEWIAWYYCCSIGQVMLAALPARLRIESNTTIVLNPDIDSLTANLTEKENEVILFLLKCKNVKVKDIESFLGIQNAMPVIQSLINKEYVSSEEVYKVDKNRKPAIVSLNQNYSDEKEFKKIFTHLEKKAPSQFSALLVFLRLQQDSNSVYVDRSKLIKEKGVNAASVKGLIDKNILDLNRVQYIPGDLRKSVEAKSLQDFQYAALEEIKASFKNNSKPVLLQGVTSSGKTEIFKHLINECIENNMQVLYLLPEIALTTQMIDRFESVYGQNLLVYHSKYSDNERSTVYHRVLQFRNQKQIVDDEFQIIIGARSSLFLPFNRLGLIIIDEEHDHSYKQKDPAPRYHARDVAVILASFHQSKIILASATPSAESYFNAQSGKYTWVKITQRYGGVLLPAMEVINMQDERTKGTLKGYFSSQLVEEIDTTLRNEEQIILFQNRRGFSSFVQCDTCQYIPECTNCDVTLTYHKYYKKLICHYCGFTEDIPSSCPDCKQNKITTKGFGTERIEDELSILFPDAIIARLDIDTAKTKSSYQRILSSFEKNETNILIGTQMVTKGFDFSNVALVGVLNADLLLNFPDFRAAERSFQMIEQVAGRAGRKQKRGKVILQTYNPEHPVISMVSKHDLDSFLSFELSERKQFLYPPFSRLIEFYLKHRKSEIVHKASKYFVQLLKEKFNDEVFGPVVPEISRVKNYYLRKILIKNSIEQSPTIIRNSIAETLHQFNQHHEYHRVQIHLDVDPY